MAKNIAHSTDPRGGEYQTLVDDTDDGIGFQLRGDDGQFDAQRARRQMKLLAWLLDDSIPIPILGFRVGVDGLLGLIPGIGDLISTGISTYIIRQASLLGVPKIVLLRMTFNTAIDLTIGAIPFIGDLFDLGWKSNKRNVRIALDHLDNPSATHRVSWIRVLSMLAGIGLALFAIVFAIGYLLVSLFG